MISQTAEYALRAVAVLADRHGEAVTTRQLAQATAVPEEYLAKVLQSLRRAGVIASRRGQGGGHALVEPPDQLTVYDIVQAVDPIARIKSCPLGLESGNGRLCPLHRKLDEAAETVEQAFRSTLITDLVPESGLHRPFCRQPDRG